MSSIEGSSWVAYVHNRPPQLSPRPSTSISLMQLANWPQEPNCTSSTCQKCQRIFMILRGLAGHVGVHSRAALARMYIRYANNIPDLAGVGPSNAQSKLRRRCRQAIRRGRVQLPLPSLTNHTSLSWYNPICPHPYSRPFSTQMMRLLHFKLHGRSQSINMNMHPASRTPAWGVQAPLGWGGFAASFYNIPPRYRTGFLSISDLHAVSSPISEHTEVDLTLRLGPHANESTTENRVLPLFEASTSTVNCRYGDYHKGKKVVVGDNSKGSKEVDLNSLDLKLHLGSKGAWPAVSAIDA